MQSKVVRAGDGDEDEDGDGLEAPVILADVPQVPRPSFNRPLILTGRTNWTERG